MPYAVPSHPTLLVTALVGAAASVTFGQTTHTVELIGFDFVPADLTIQEGDMVLWDWVSGFHNVESGVIQGGVGIHDGNFRSGDPTADASTTYSVTFDQAFLDAHPMPNDTYPYYCIEHVLVNMAGTIVVEREQTVPAVSTRSLLAGLAGILALGGWFAVRRGRRAGDGAT